MAQGLLRAHVHEGGASPASREALLDGVLAHDRALRVLLGGRRAPPVEAVRATWRELLGAVLRRLPQAGQAETPLDGLRTHLDALRAAGVPSAEIVAAVSAWRMGRM